MNLKLEQSVQASGTPLPLIKMSGSLNASSLGCEIPLIGCQGAGSYLGLGTQLSVSRLNILILNLCVISR